MNRDVKKGILISLILLCFVGIVSIFWFQEAKFLLPTPIPENHVNVSVGKQVSLDVFEGYSQEKPLLVHFFQKTCPCSRFNIKELKRLVKKYDDEVDFIVVLESESSDGIAVLKEGYGVNVPVYHDPKGKISDHFGVYSTPQAVILKDDASIYYKGNYNQARYCTKKTSAFADIALENLIQDLPLPVFSQLATTAYGCSLPSDDTLKTNSIDILFQN